MSDYCLGEAVLQEKLFCDGTPHCDDRDKVVNLKKAAVREAFELFVSHHGPDDRSSIRAAVAPARVNLIGEHVDYCDGFVLPIAIPLYTAVVGVRAPVGRGYTTVYSSTMNESVRIAAPYGDERGEYPSWSRYVRGVLALYHTEEETCYDMVIVSHIPPGAGLSSSAALELAVLMFVRQFHQDSLSRTDCALLCRKAEHDYAKVPCGYMDQMVIACAEAEHALKIDCRSLSCESVPMAISHEVVFVVTNSGVKHSLAEGEYAKRKASVDKAIGRLGCSSWRDVSHDLLQQRSERLREDVLLPRSRHVVGEIARTAAAATALLDNNIKQFGQLMRESHASLRDEYAVSCVELDQLVELAGQVEGVFGSRMTGGGFGGCTVTMVRTDAVQAYKQHVEDHYSGEATFYECEPVGGVEEMSVEFLIHPQ